MSKLDITLACWDYDRTRALQDGRVQVEGVRLNFLPMPVEETFYRMIRFAEFDVSEMSLSSYVISLLAPEPRFVALPIFLSRMFRHSSIYISDRSGIASPADLVGKRVGIPEYQMTAPVWIRGILDEHYGVPLDSVTYLTGGEEQPGRVEKQPISLPPSIRLQSIGPDKTLARMLAEGEIDALYTARKPSTYDGRRVRRLFPDPQPVEAEYYRKTGIFPIMHVVAIRREVYEANRWLAQSLTKAFEQAQAQTYVALRETAALKTMLPWANLWSEQTVDAMGADFWPYGLERNREALATFLRYHHKGGLSPRELMPEELFAPESIERFKI